MSKDRYNSKKKFKSDNLTTLFEKHEIISEENDLYNLPEPGDLFKDPEWKIEYLESLKKELNDTKSLLNDFNLDVWQNHTKQRNKAGSVFHRVRKVVDPELLTQAWCKFYEIASSFKLVPEFQNFTSVHLCEAPGAFITALNHWLRVNAPDIDWDWIGTSLNPYYEGNHLSTMIDDDRFIRHTLKHWNFGLDRTGNLMDWKNLNNLIEDSKRKDFPVLLVTADGSIDCSSIPDEQESTISSLNYCETIAAFHLVAKGGNFLMKIFTIFEHQTICLLYLLCCSFERVVVTKPATSKEGNSESYLVCLGFKGKDELKPYLEIIEKYYLKGDEISGRAMFSKQDMGEKFLTRVQECACFFKTQQCFVISKNVESFGESKMSGEMKDVKHAVAKMYLERCRLIPLVGEELEIVGKGFLQATAGINVYRKIVQDSFTNRCKKKYSTIQCQLVEVENSIGVVPTTMDSFQLKSTKIPESLWINLGKEFKTLNSSRFCQDSILKLKHKVDQVPSLPKTKLQFINNWDSGRTIEFIYNEITKLQVGENLLLAEFPLLTQLNVGLLYLLANTFEYSQVKTDPEYGYVISLERFTSDETVMHFFQQIINKFEESKRNSTIVLTILQIGILYDWESYQSIVALNHWIIKLYIEQMVSSNMTRLIHQLSNQGIIPKICIVGAGPAAFYAAQQLLKCSKDLTVDLLERLPVPFGLVRFGVAPDHPEVKNVINSFHKIATNPRFRFVGNVKVGKDIGVDRLKEIYHTVLLTYGAEEDKKLGIPGENLDNVISGRNFVGWYNGLPSDKNLNINLDVEEAVVIGQGNVAVDIARILLTPIDQLKTTDMTSFALDKLSESKIRKVCLVGRRGPLHAAYTIAELREMINLPCCKTVWRRSDFQGIENILDTLKRPRKRLTELMIKSLQESIPSQREKQFSPIFLRSPIEFLGTSSVESVRFAINQLTNEDDFILQKSLSTELFEDIPCGLVFRSIGYKSVQIDPNVPFDFQNGRVINKFGKVDDNLYAAGWVATGPSGVILSTMTNAFQVGESIHRGVCGNLESKPGFRDLIHVLERNNIPMVSYQGWEKIDRVERERGKLVNKPREKIVDVMEMLDIAIK